MWAWGFLWVAGRGAGGCAHVQAMPPECSVLTQTEGQPPSSWICLYFSLGAGIWPLGCATGPILAPKETQELERPLGIRADDIFISTELLGCY